MLAVNELLTSPGSCLFADATTSSRPCTRVLEQAGGPLMFDLAALGIAAVCFAFCFFFLFAMEKV